MRASLTELNVVEKSEFFCNGQEIIDRVKEILTSIPESQVAPVLAKPYPIGTLLLDFLMPLKNGVQVIQEVKALYKKRHGNVQLKEPVYAITTNFDAGSIEKQFATYCISQGADVVIMKPLSKSDLQDLIQDAK